MKILRCITCGRFLSEEDFYWFNSKRTKRRNSCKRCSNYMLKLNGVIKKYQNNNRDIINERARQYRLDNYETVIARARVNDRKRNKTTHRKEYRRKHKQKLRAHYTAMQRERDAMKLNQTPDNYDKGTVEKLYQLSNIFTKDLWQDYHVDHIQPLSKGGEHRAKNLQVVTATQNISKFNDENSTLKGITKQDLLNHPEIFNTILVGRSAEKGIKYWRKPVANEPKDNLPK